MNGVLLGSALGVAAFLAAVGVVLCVAVVLHWQRDREQGLIPYIFYPTVFLAVLAVVVSGRNLNLPLDLVGAAVNKNLLVTWGNRITSVFLLLAAAERIGNRLLHMGTKPLSPTPLVLAFCLFFLTNVVTSGLFASHPSFSHYYIYTFLAGCAALLAASPDGDIAIRSARNALFASLVLSAACAVWRPEMVLSRDYEGLIPWLRVRYAGLSNSPNALGALVVLFLLCLWSRPYSRRWLSLLGWMIGCASLLLSQSKTSWIAFAFCASCFAYFRHGDLLAQHVFSFGRPLLLQLSILVGMLIGCYIGIALMFGGVVERAADFFATTEGASLLTLTGRDRIWEVAAQEWRHNPLFGYGLTIWNDEYRAEMGLRAAFNAHSQFYQSLASAGLFGVAGLSIYVLTLFWFVLKTTRASQGLTLALFLLLFIQSISEVPLSMTTGYGLVQLPHLLLLIVLASQFASRRTEPLGATTPWGVKRVKAKVSRNRLQV